MTDASNNFDGKIIIQNTGAVRTTQHHVELAVKYNNPRTRVTQHYIEIAFIYLPANVAFDGKVKVLRSATGVFDGLVEIAGGYGTGQFDGKTIIRATGSDDYDGLVVISDDTIGRFSGKIRIYRPATGAFDGRAWIIYIGGPDPFDGKAVVQDVAVDVFDGAARIKSSATAAFDGRCWIIYLADALFDGKAFIQNLNPTRVTQAYAEALALDTASVPDARVSQQYAEVMGQLNRYAQWQEPGLDDLGYTLATWPDGVPAPLRDNLVITPMDTVAARRTQTGRVEMRRSGGTDAPDLAEVIVRCTPAQARLFRAWYQGDGDGQADLGVRWFTADWFAEIGYSGYYGRIIGYPRRRSQEAPTPEVGHADYELIVALKQYLPVVPWLRADWDGRKVRVTQAYAEGMGEWYDPITRVTQQYSEPMGNWPDPIVYLTQQYAEAGGAHPDPMAYVTQQYAEVMVRV